MLTHCRANTRRWSNVYSNKHWNFCLSVIEPRKTARVNPLIPAEDKYSPRTWDNWCENFNYHRAWHSRWLWRHRREHFFDSGSGRWQVCLSLKPQGTIALLLPSLLAWVKNVENLLNTLRYTVTAASYCHVVQRQKAVSAYFTRKQILPIGFCIHHWMFCCESRDGDNPSRKSQDVDLMLVSCWPSVVDGWQRINQHWVNVSCLLG